jgi:hypothetical protein
VPAFRSWHFSDVPLFKRHVRCCPNNRLKLAPAVSAACDSRRTSPGQRKWDNQPIQCLAHPSSPCALMDSKRQGSAGHARSIRRQSVVRILKLGPARERKAVQRRVTVRRVIETALVHGRVRIGARTVEFRSLSLHRDETGRQSECTPAIPITVNPWCARGIASYRSSANENRLVAAAAARSVSPKYRCRSARR